MYPTLATAYSPDLTLITNASDAVTAIVAAAVLVFTLAFGWPVAKKVFGIAKRVLGAA